MHKNSPRPPDDPTTIAIIMGHWLGDTFWASQTLPALREQFSGSDFYVILRRDYSALFRGLVDPDRIIIVPELVSDRKREKVHLLRMMISARRLRKKYDFDWVIDLTGNRFSALFCRFLTPKWLCGFNGDELGGFYHCRTFVDRNQLGHLSEQPFMALEPVLGKVTVPDKLRAPTPVYDKDEVFQRLMLDPRRPVAVIAPGGGWKEKRWKQENYAKLARMIFERGYQTVITGAPDELHLCEAISGFAGIEARVSCSGDLDDLISLVSVADLFVGNDSGPGHLAAAAGCRSIIIFLSGGDAKLTGALGDDVTICDGGHEFVIPETVIKKIFPEE